MVDEQTIGGLDVGTQVAQGLAPLAEVVVALNAQTTLLSRIHQTIQLGGTGLQPNTGQQRVVSPVQATARPSPYTPPPAAPPGPTGTPTPIPQGTAGALGAPGAPGGPGGPGGGGGGPTGPGAAPAGGPPAGRGFADTGGEGLVNRLYNKAIDKVPALSIPNSIRNEYQSQFNKNAFYTGITGAEGQGEAFGMRFQEEKERFDTMRLFSEEEFRQMHRGLASMGINTRDEEGAMPGRITYAEAQDFAYGAKERYGATMEESLKVLSIASKQASIDLEGLNDHLDALSVAAGDAGASAAEARAAFTQALEVNTAVGGLTGDQGAAWAASSTAANVMAGPQFAGDASYSRVATDTGYRAMLAASNGMTPGEMSTMMRNDPAAVANMQTETYIEYMRQYIQSIEPEGWAWLEEQCAIGGESPSDLANEFLTYHWSSSQDPYILVEYSNAFQGSPQQFNSPDKVIAYLAKEMMGVTTGALMGKEQAAAGATDLSGKSKADPSVEGLDYDISELADSEEETASGGGTTGTAPRVVGGRGGWQAGAVGAASGEGVDEGKAGEATSVYMERAQSSGERVGVLDTMLKEMTGKEEEDQRVLVQTKDGKRIVSLAEAMKDFPDQLATGRAKFVGGEKAGKGIGAYNEGAVQTDAEAKERSEASAEKESSVGESAEEYWKAHPEDKFLASTSKKTKGGKQVIELGPIAAKYFKMIESGGDSDPTQPEENGNLFGAAARIMSPAYGAVSVAKDLW